MRTVVLHTGIGPPASRARAPHLTVFLQPACASALQRWHFKKKTEEGRRRERRAQVQCVDFADSSIASLVQLAGSGPTKHVRQMALSAMKLQLSG